MFRNLTLALSAALTMMAPAHAGIGPQLAPNIGADLSIGTPGISGNVQWQVTPFVTLRGGINYFEFELDDLDFDGIEYEAEFDFTNIGLYVDFHPFMNGFTVSGGYLFGDRTINLDSRPTRAIEIGDQTFTPEEVGELLGEADFGDGGLYGGIGWDSTTRGLLPVAIVVRAGLVVTDAPDISLVSRGGLAESDPTLQARLNAELAEEIQGIEDDADSFRYYPMISVGIGFGF
ncbi:MAG: hypothetical protein AAF788_01840 [Pseudomonadota bacterium]